MKKIKRYGSLLALSTGLLLLGGLNAHAQSLGPNYALKSQLEKAESTSKSLKNSNDFSKVEKILKPNLQKGFKSYDFKGNLYHEVEPNNDIYSANYLGLEDRMDGDFSDNSIDTYRIDVPLDNQIVIGGLMLNATSLTDIGFLLFDSMNNPINPTSYQQGNHELYQLYDLHPGTYYIKTGNTTQNLTSDPYEIAWDYYTPPTPPVVNKVDDNDTVVTGQTEPNSWVDVVLNGTLIGTTQAWMDGKFTVSIPVEHAGTLLSVYATNSEGYTSVPTNITVVASQLNGWVVENGKRYYYVNGVKQTGWLSYNKHWYYLDKSNSGAMKTGWLLYNNKWYFLNKQTGVMATGWVLDGKWYYLNSDGSMKTGWLYYGGNWYYLNSNGSMATGWVYTGGKWYYLYSSGIMAHDTKIGSYRLGHDGAWIH